MTFTLVFEDRIRVFGGEVRTVHRRHSFEGDISMVMKCMEDWIKINCAMFDVVRVFFEAAERGDRRNGAVMTVFIEDANNFQSWLGYVKEDFRWQSSTSTHRGSASARTATTTAMNR